MDTPTNITDQLKRDEGFRSEVYIDSVGKRTIGYGHNLDANPLPVTTVTEAQAIDILHTDIARVTVQLRGALVWFDTLDEVRQGVLTNMAFNMGMEGLLGFHNTLYAVQYGDWNAASYGMEHSAWYDQVGERARRLVAQMQEGRWF
jgi:lysozyme